MSDGIIPAPSRQSETKVCCHCHIEKPTADFWRNASTADGFQFRCKECQRLAGVAAYENNRERLAAKRGTPEYKQAYAAYWAQYYTVHGERHKAAKRQRYADAPEAVKLHRHAYDATYRATRRTEQLERERRWRRLNPEGSRLKGIRRRALRNSAAGSASVEQVKARVAFYGHRCAYCGGEYSHLDHVIPLARGGTNWPANLRPACGHCNTSKGTKRLHEWRRQAEHAIVGTPKPDSGTA